MRARHPRGVEEGSGGEEFGVHGLLLWVCPFAGWRIVEVTRDYKEKDRPVAFPILLLSDLSYQRLQRFKFISNEYPITL
jgi:hypothetical protein